MQLPGPYTNRFFIAVHGGTEDNIVKISLGEAEENDAITLHAAVTMSKANAEALARALLMTLEQHAAKPELASAGDNVKPIR